MTIYKYPRVEVVDNTFVFLDGEGPEATLTIDWEYDTPLITKAILGNQEIETAKVDLFFEFGSNGNSANLTIAD